MNGAHNDVFTKKHEAIVNYTKQKILMNKQINKTKKQN